MLADFFASYQQELSAALAALDTEQLEALCGMMEATAAKGGTIYVLGNGGSASCASHWVCDMGKGARNPAMPHMKVSALSDNTGTLTAIANDITYDQAFAYQLEALAEPDDLVIGLSVSGSSPTIVHAFETAKAAGCATVCIIGGLGGVLGGMAGLSIVVPSKNYGVVEDVHLIINHFLSQYMREKGHAVCE